MQSLLQLLEANIEYIRLQAIENEIEKKRLAIKSSGITRVSFAERKRRREAKLKLDPKLCHICQKEPKYVTKNNVAYGSICYTCMTKKRLGASYKDKSSPVSAPSSPEYPDDLKSQGLLSLQGSRDKDFVFVDEDDFGENGENDDFLGDFNEDLCDADDKC